MYSSSSVSKRHVMVPILAVVAIQFLLNIPSVFSLNMTNAYLQHKCFVSQGKYKPGSEYEKDLIDIIDSLPLTSNFTRGFEMSSSGEGPNYVSVTHQCRGDSYGAKCRSCYSTTISELRRRCPRYKGGIIWYDQCLLVISAVNYFGKIDYDNNFCISNAKKFSVGHYSNVPWGIFIDNLTTIAISEKNPTELYAAGERKIGRDKVYGMVQCTQDLSSKGCLECVTSNSVNFQKCMFYKRGARVIGRSCNIRYEFYPFVAVGPNYLKT
ncbi:LOW QUALITY PROTEIN: putative cysteine-rich repeat secretory protein 17 [Eutrema salsugineum]|uniref:LOW QUALITY PROTEIN: putative cysteine-rich repeat secretory protein 17 n=1 Tax=Eutrema salsugineum TaxID=72664 RepID=UPI000CED32BE|nr:LOW QUALITY PROTEIN: putative cysteine-rich repeat secretory protein 17 [Eutrema salsugineum]